MVKLLKKPVIITHICTFAQSVQDLTVNDVSSLTEIHYSQIEASEKRTHTTEDLMLKMFYLQEVVN